MLEVTPYGSDNKIVCEQYHSVLTGEKCGCQMKIIHAEEQAKYTSSTLGSQQATKSFYASTLHFLQFVNYFYTTSL